MRKYHVIRLTKGRKRGRWAVAQAIDSWVDGCLELVIAEGEDHFYSPSSAKGRADELETSAEVTNERPRFR